ncbi:MAG: cation-translocating P-type ATPase [Candidatus Riflebacteria bacterium]|nr:cation-translocating P-type ATPase [Candidatus Riflebacteria bacterium]
MSSKTTNSRYKGLSPEKVEENRKKFGSNKILPPEPEPWWKLYLEKFDDPIIKILMVAAFLAVLTGLVEGTPYEGIAIILTIFLATFFSFLNEWKARLEFNLLIQIKEDTPVKTIREENVISIPRSGLVVEDIVILETGDEIPADGVLFEALSLSVDESKLTGESFPVAKIAKVKKELDLSQSEILSETMVFRGTMVTEGFGIMKISAVGNETESGKVAKMATENINELTPLGKQLEKLGKLISLFGFVGALLIFFALFSRGYINGDFRLSFPECFFLFVVATSIAISSTQIWAPYLTRVVKFFGYEIEFGKSREIKEPKVRIKPIIRGFNTFLGLIFLGLLFNVLSPVPNDWFNFETSRIFLKYFMIVVAVIVVAVPEGLPMAVTLCLAYGMRKMMADHNLVRNLHACETIGAVTVICSDKTGTLTKNEMSVEIPAFSGFFAEKPCSYWETLSGKLVSEGISANSTANLSRTPSGEVQSIGNRTEGALLIWLNKEGIDYRSLRDNFKLEHQWIFCPKRKFMASFGQSKFLHGKPILYFKGAPETILEKCSKILRSDETFPMGEEREILNQLLQDFQCRGMRTLAFAFCNYDSCNNDSNVPGNFPSETENQEIDEIEKIAHDLTWLGCVAIADPVRPEVRKALELCLKAGVDVKIITGDNSQTAIEIARQIGLWTENEDPERHICGCQFQELSDKQATKVLGKLKILSRAKPLDKLRAVVLLKQAGEVVAVTGDGANDAPALHHADVGLSMGKVGTDMAKEASDIVLLDDSFASIATAILWGRCLYLNIQRFLVFQLSINVTALAITLLCPILGLPIPLTVLQMLWINLIMDSFAALALATEPPVKILMDKPPRKQENFIISPEMAINIIAFGLSSTVFFIGLLLFFQQNGPGSTTEYGLSMFFTILVMVQFWNLFNVRRFGLPSSAFDYLSIFSNPWFIFVAIIILFGQILIVQFGGVTFRTVPLDFYDWLIIIVGTSPVLFWPKFVDLIAKSWKLSFS